MEILYEIATFVLIASFHGLASNVKAGDNRLHEGVNRLGIEVTKARKKPISASIRCWPRWRGIESLDDRFRIN